MKNKIYFCITFLLFINICHSQYHLTKSVFTNGGIIPSAANSNYAASIGQILIGSSTFDKQNCSAGFWYAEMILLHSQLINTAIPIKYELFQNYPNPFNPVTRIKFSLPKPERVIIEVFNTLGQKILTVKDRNTSIGFHEVYFNAYSLPSGLYFYRIRAGNFNDVKRMVLTK